MTGGQVVATDDIGSVHYQIIKLAYGALETATLVTGSVGLPAVLLAGTAEIGKLAAGTANIGDVDILTIAAGDNNIGNVDIVSFPAGNLGMQLMAASVSTVPASNITDATYIGDIKFGESLPAGTAAIGKLAANSGVDIGDVDVTTMPAMTIAAAQTLATVTTVSTVTNLSQLGGAAVPIGAGLEATAIRVTLPTDGTGVVKLGAGTAAFGKLAANSGVDIGDVDILSIAAGDNNIGNVDIVTVPTDPFGANADASSATGSISAKLKFLAAGIAGATSLPAGTNAIGKLAANSGVDIGDVDVTSISAGTNLIGDVDIQPRTTGGWSVGNFTSGDTYTALTATAQVIKASAGKFGGYYIYNPNSAATYVFIYNIAAASVTVGTSTALLVFCIPATSGANLELLAGIPFGTAMSIAAATTGGGNTAPTTALEAMIFYK